jgi:hypothetical protein
LGTAAFPVSRRGFADLLRWLGEFGELDRVGIEGTGRSVSSSLCK